MGAGRFRQRRVVMVVWLSTEIPLVEAITIETQELATRGVTVIGALGMMLAMTE